MACKGKEVFDWNFLDKGRAMVVLPVALVASRSGLIVSKTHEQRCLREVSLNPVELARISILVLETPSR